MTGTGRAWAVAIGVLVGGMAVAANRFKVPPVLLALTEELGSTW